MDKIKNVLKVGQDVSARVIKIDRGERRIGLSIKAAAYSDEQLKEEQKMLNALKPGEDLVALQHAFDAARRSGQIGIILRTKFNSRTGGLETVRLFFVFGGAGSATPLNSFTDSWRLRPSGTNYFSSDLCR